MAGEQRRRAPADTEEPAFPGLVGEAPPSPAGPIEPALAAELPKPPIVPLPRAAQMLRFTQRQIEYVFGARRRLGEIFSHAHRDARRPCRHQPSRPRALALHRQTRVGALADRRVAAAADPRHRLGPHLARRPPHAPAQAAAAALPRRGDRALHGDDPRGDRTRARPLAAEPPLRAGPAHAGDHPRRDHGRDLRHRGPARARHPRAPHADHGQAAGQRLHLVARPGSANCSTSAAKRRSA